MHSMSEYKNHLEGLKLQTKLNDHIKVMDRSIEEQVHSDSCQYDRSSYSKLEVTLAEEINLNFVDRIWKFIAKHYNLPSLPHALLDRIEAKNLMVTWRVPVLSGLQIQAHCTEGSEKFFQQHKITRVVLNDEPLYGSGLNKEKLSALKADSQETLESNLNTASNEGNLKLVVRLLETGLVSINATDPEKESWTSLMHASWKGHLEVVKHLISRGASVNATSNVGWTPLILASREGHCEVMEILIDHGANIGQKTTNGWSSLMIAADFGRTKAGKLLLEKKAKINCLDKKNYTPLAEACQNGHHEFVSMMIEHDPTIRLDGEPEGTWTPLMLACRKNHLKTAEVLIRHGASMDKAKDDQVGPLHIACYEGFDEMVNLLVRKKANPDAQDCVGVSPLLMAVKQGHINIVKTLLWNAQANLNLQEKKVQHSAIFFAVHCKQNDMLDLFMGNRGLDLTIRDISGSTIIEYAKEHNDEAFLHMNKNYGNKLEQMNLSLLKQPSAASQPWQSLPITRKEMRNRVDEMMQELDRRMGGLHLE